MLTWDQNKFDLWVYKSQIDIKILEMNAIFTYGFKHTPNFVNTYLGQPWEEKQ